jgi:Homeodomain-like domain
MSLREVTRTVLKLVEDASGCPVVVNEDRSLTTLAISRIARGANRVHSISFNPSAVREPDYLISYQCGFILRNPTGVAKGDPASTAHAVKPPLERLFAKHGERGIVQAYKEHGYPLHKIGEHLGIHYATVSRRLKQMEQEK